MRRQSTRQSSRSFSARSSPTPPRRILKCALKPRTAQPQERPTLQSAQRLLNLDAIHDTVHEMARDEARHGKAFAGLLKRYFGK